MKKYLMTIATAAMCATFTSCSHDFGFEQTTQDEADKSKFESVFVSRFGQPAADQDWGYSEFARKTTRSENANANEWADPNKAYGGLQVPPPLTDEQIAVVKEYFQTVQYPTYEDPHWTNYFMQQVYKGYTDPWPGKSPEAYLAADGHTYIYASDNMDHLAAINGNFVDHINNFNHGDCSTNGTVLDNGGNANDGPFHSDKIMYMKESTTKSFGYYNSNGSVRRTEYTGLVSFQTIINKLGSKANCLDDGWNRSFMGFDFEQMIDDQILAKEFDYSVPWSASLPDGYPIKDYKWFEWNGKKYHVLSANQNMYCGTPLECNDTDLQTAGFVDNLLSQGYLPVENSANKKWVKVGGCADGYYSDWIVCLTEAKKSTIVIPPADVRIIAEDLTTSEKGDFDFNDVVFDVVYDYKPGKSAIILQAAGGTYPLYVAGYEVHKQLGNRPTNVMINTGRGPNEDPVLIEIDAVSHGLDIEVKVDKPQGIVVLECNQGRAPHKIAVKPSFVWCNERDDIELTYRNFSQWVIDPSVSWY